jgi:hypothetical protein
MSGIKSINLGLAFLLELCLLVIFGYWGVFIAPSLTLKVILGGSLPLVLTGVWGKFLAPASSTRLKEPGLSLTKVVIFSLAALCLYSTELSVLAIVFWVIAMGNLILLYNYSRF